MNTVTWYYMKYLLLKLIYWRVFTGFLWFNHLIYKVTFQILMDIAKFLTSRWHLFIQTWLPYPLLYPLLVSAWCALRPADTFMLSYVSIWVLKFVLKTCPLYFFNISYISSFFCHLAFHKSAILSKCLFVCLFSTWIAASHCFLCSQSHIPTSSPPNLPTFKFFSVFHYLQERNQTTSHGLGNFWWSSLPSVTILPAM